MSKICCLCYWRKIVYWCQWVRIWIINGRCLYLVLYAKLLSLWMNSRFGQNDKLSFYFSCFYVWHQMLKVFIVFVIFFATFILTGQGWPTIALARLLSFILKSLVLDGVQSFHKTIREDTWYIFATHIHLFFSGCFLVAATCMYTSALGRRGERWVMKRWWYATDGYGLVSCNFLQI